MCCVMDYTGHDLPAEKFKEYLLRTVDRGRTTSEWWRVPTA